MTATPRVSVILPVFNAERFVGEAIGSLLAQTFEDFEVLAIDDGSTDRSALVAAGYADPRLRVLEQAHLGLPAALNHGIRAAKGELIARMDADDRTDPGRFAQQVALLDDNPSVALVGSCCYKIDESGRRFDSYDVPLSDWDIKLALATGCPFVHPSIMMRRSALDRVGLYRDHEAEDYDLVLRISERFEVRNLGERLVEVRRVPGTRMDLYLDDIVASSSDRRAKSLERYLCGQDGEGYPEIAHRTVLGVPLRDLPPQERRPYADTLAATAHFLRWKDSVTSGRLYRRALLVEPFRPHRWRDLFLAELRRRPRLYRAVARATGRGS